jgi:hypothetical protein
MCSADRAVARSQARHQFFRTRRAERLTADRSDHIPESLALADRVSGRALADSSLRPGGHFRAGVATSGAARIVRRDGAPPFAEISNPKLNKYSHLIYWDLKYRWTNPSETWRING